MEIKLNRIAFTELSTIGKLILPEQVEYYTLEDTDRGLRSDMTLEEIADAKVWGKTAIPEGRYKVTITPSRRFKRLMPLLNDVSGFSGVRIHCGNVSEDTNGCILVGCRKEVDKIIDSKKAYDELFPILRDTLERGEEIFITIQKDEFVRKMMV